MMRKVAKCHARIWIDEEYDDSPDETDTSEIITLDDTEPLSQAEEQVTEDHSDKTTDLETNKSPYEENANQKKKKRF